MSLQCFRVSLKMNGRGCVWEKEGLIFSISKRRNKMSFNNNNNNNNDNNNNNNKCKF